MSNPAQNARQRYLPNDRERIIGEAVRLKKIAPQAVDRYRQLYDSNPSAYGNLLTASVEQGGLMPGLMLGGHGDVGQEPTREYPAAWVPEANHAPPGGGIAFEDPATAATATAEPALQAERTEPATATYPKEWLAANAPRGAADDAGDRVVIGND